MAVALPHPAPSEEGLISVDDLREATGGPSDASAAYWCRVHATACRMVNDYAPDAPLELRNEAIVRFAGYLTGSDFGGIRVTELGPQRFEFITNHSGMFRSSGAAALLTRYKKRRAGAI